MKRQPQPFFSALLQSRIFFAALIVVTLVSVFRLTNEIARRTKIHAELAGLRKQTVELQKEHASLSTLIDYLKTDTYIESDARKKLNLANPGEKLVIVTDSEIEANRAYAPNSSDPVSLWWEFFFSTQNR